MKYKNFDRETAALLDQTRQVAAQRALARETLKAEIEAEWARRMEQFNIQLATNVWKLMDANAEGKVTLTAIQDAARLKNYDRWLAFLSEYENLRPAAQAAADAEHGYRVLSLSGYTAKYGYIAARIEFSDDTVIDAPAYMLLTKEYEEGYVPEVVFLTPEQLAAIRAFVTAGPSDTWVAQSTPREGTVGTEAEIDAVIAKSPSPEYAPKKKNLHEYISEHLDRQEGK